MRRQHAINIRLASCFLGFLLVLGLVAHGVSANENDQALERELSHYAPKFVEYLLDRGCRSVGVLKFRVKKGNAPISDNVGTLNTSLSERLRASLILKSGSSTVPQLGIISNANSVAQDNGQANHLYEAGRRVFFSAEGFELAWKAPPVKADAFLTGVALIPAALDELRVVVQSFDRFSDNLKLQALADFRVPMTPDILRETNDSFLLRGGFDGGKVIFSDATQAAVKVQNNVETQFPLIQDDNPVELLILYDGQKQAIELRNGKAFVPEPEQGQEVRFFLVHTGRIRGRLGVVLKVNGENTLFRQRKKDIDCAMWIVSPNTRTQIKAFQKEGSSEDGEKFVVLSEEQSVLSEINYGVDVGTISITVFREATERFIPDISDDAEDLAAIGNPVFPVEKPDSADALRSQLRRPPVLRGMFTAGEDISQRVRTVEFEPDRVPIMTATIHYYEPRNRRSD